MLGDKLKIAYALHAFPFLTEDYVFSEIEALMAKGVEVLIFAGFRPKHSVNIPAPANLVSRTTYLSPFKIKLLIEAFYLCLRHSVQLKDIYARTLFGGEERFILRIKALAHSVAGAYFALLLKDHKVTHIHANHGYFASWIAMVAARMLGITFSISFRGSDLLIDKRFLDLKISCCAFCFTISNHSKRFLLEQFPGTDPEKVIVQYLGVNIDRNE